MTPSRLTGFILTAIGLLSGLVLVAQPFTAQLNASPLVMGILFPACLLAGLPLYAAGADRAGALNITGAALLGLGLFALLGLFVDGTGLLPALYPPLALWLVAPGAIAGGLTLTYFAGALARLVAAGR